jgi:hypothetical protein
MSRLFAIMGSGETTPTMTATHRALKAAAGAGTAVMLDTPYGFQENADDITDRALDYFAKSVLFTPQVAVLRSGSADTVAIAKGMGQVRQASWVFTGPGSPTYALRQWHQFGMPQLLAEKLERQGVLIMSSAAALTVGVHTVPVYEIYKVGAVPEWFAGMDLLAPYGLDVALIPHFDNSEGGNHDTRFCYLGETRLRKLEADLSPEQWVLGVDEHTALILDLEADTYSVQGKGGVTVRRQGAEAVFRSGHHGPLDELRSMPGTVVATRLTSAASTSEPEAGVVNSSVLHAMKPCADRVEMALVAKDVPTAVGALVSAEEVLEEWKGDTSTTDERDRARQLFHGLIVSLGDLAVKGSQDPRELVGPVVDVVLLARKNARERKDWAESDQLRDALLAASIEVRDTAEGAEWSFRG